MENGGGEAKQVQQWLKNVLLAFLILSKSLLKQLDCDLNEKQWKLMQASASAKGQIKKVIIFHSYVL